MLEEGVRRGLLAGDFAGVDGEVGEGEAGGSGRHRMAWMAWRPATSGSVDSSAGTGSDTSAGKMRM